MNGETVHFNVSVTLTSCTEEMKRGEQTTQPLYVPGYGQLLMSIEGLCQCDCEQNVSVASDNCSNNGDYACGKCSCYDDWTDSDCSIPVNAPLPKGLNDLVCSGRGIGSPGKCVCDQPNVTHEGVESPMIFGESCECDNFMCEKGIDGLVCSGLGTCNCSNGVHECSCAISPITGLRNEGTACQCSYDRCVDPDDSCRESGTCKLCNERGSCDPCVPPGLSGCACNSNLDDQYCQRVLSFGHVQCDASQDCVQCHSRGGTGLPTAVECQNLSCDNFTLDQEEVPNDYQIPNSLIDTTIKCSFIGADRCTYNYYTGEGIDGNTLTVVHPPVCGVVLANWQLAVVITVSVVIVTIIVGIILLKISVVIHNHRLKKIEKIKAYRQNNPAYQPSDAQSSE